ncbi:MAG: minor capsid protein [Ruminiclostridium sp.]|nr:minor capsid protein [Ruminiclostridium sp.]
MKKRSKAYWEKRAADRMVDYMADAERTSNTLGKAYYSVGRYLSDEAAKILKSFTDTFGLSESEARRLIGNTPEKSITEKLKKALPKIADKDKRRQAEAMISSPAYSYRIKRLENLGKNVRKQCSQLYNTEVLADDSFFRGLCDDAYKHCIFDMQKGKGMSSAFDIMPTSRINRILSSKWSGEHFSARVWGNTNALADGLQSDLLVGIMSGKSEKKMAEDIMNRCAVGAFEARRLVRTEACYIANQAELDGYRQTGIESYEFSAVLDNRTSKLCDNVDGLDGKIFKISEAVPGKNLPPMHPFCRSTTLPILPSEEELDREIAELSDEIGADVDYEEWKENLQETGDGRLVYRAKETDVGYIDVLEEYNNKSTPGQGTIVYDDGYNASIHKAEMSFAEWLLEHYGGEIKLLQEVNKNNIVTPDYIWNEKLWDLKTVTTEKAANSAIRKGLKQIEENPGGIILDYKDLDISEQELQKVIDKRMKWHEGKTVDIMVVNKGKVLKIIRYT